LNFCFYRFTIIVGVYNTVNCNFPNHLVLRWVPTFEEMYFKLAIVEIYCGNLEIIIGSMYVGSQCQNGHMKMSRHKHYLSQVSHEILDRVASLFFSSIFVLHVTAALDFM